MLRTAREGRNRSALLLMAWVAGNLLALHLLAAIALYAQQDKWELAAGPINRLSVSAFPSLPPGFRDLLQKRGCLVPQSFAQETPHNVIHGEFAKKGQTDWAALCSRDGKSSVMVSWGGAASCPSELAQGDDVHSLTATAAGVIRFARHLGSVDEGFIRTHYEAYGGVAPPAVIDHSGIDYRFLEKGSVVFYCHRGKWLRLSGAD